MKTYLEFVTEWHTNILPNKPKHIRTGQCLMNYLADEWLSEYKKISSVHYYDKTNIDCFFNDDLLDNTLEHLERVWNNENNSK